MTMPKVTSINLYKDQVEKLKREKYAIFDIKGLNVGEYRKLTFKEVSTLYSLFK